MSAIPDYKIDQHKTPVYGQALSHSVPVHPERKFGWKERVVERVITAEAKGIAYKILVKALAIFACLLLGMSIIGFPIALWGACEYTRQICARERQLERKENQKACASHAIFISMCPEKLRPQLIKDLGYSEDKAQTYESTALLRQAITKWPDYLLKHPLT